MNQYIVYKMPDGTHRVVSQATPEMQFMLPPGATYFTTISAPNQADAERQALVLAGRGNFPRLNR